jgi:hypothetical protein
MPPNTRHIPLNRNQHPDPLEPFPTICTWASTGRSPVDDGGSADMSPEYRGLPETAKPLYSRNRGLTTIIKVSQADPPLLPSSGWTTMDFRHC